MMSLLFLGIICLTTIIVVTTITSSVSAAKRYAADKKAEVDQKQIESAFPPEKPEPASLEQQAFDMSRLHRQQILDSKKKALDHLLQRRSMLEGEIAKLRTSIQSYADKSYATYRADAVSALNDARKEQQELVVEQERLLATMKGRNDVDAPEEPVRVATGGPVAGRVDDPDLVHDAESDEQETGREGTA